MTTLEEPQCAPRSVTESKRENRIDKCKKKNMSSNNVSKGHGLQDPFLNALRREKVPVSIFLVNGIKLQGQIESFDQFVILLKNAVSQIVFKHGISTVVPARNVSLSDSDTH